MIRNNLGNNLSEIEAGKLEKMLSLGVCKFFANSLRRAKVVFLLNNIMIINENKEMMVAVNAIYGIEYRSLKKIQDFNGV